MTETSDQGEKPEGDYSESRAFRTDEDGKPHLVMEALSKGGDSPNDRD
jgi:hypothetical protein